MQYTIRYEHLINYVFDLCVSAGSEAVVGNG